MTANLSITRTLKHSVVFNTCTVIFINEDKIIILYLGEMMLKSRMKLFLFEQRMVFIILLIAFVAI